MIARLPRLRLWSICAASACLASTASPAQAENPPPASAFAPLVTWSGPDSAIAQRTFQRIQREEEWARLWAQHCGPDVKKDRFGRPNAPHIDFDRCVVLVICQGDRINSDGVIFISAEEKEREIIWRFDDASYQTASFGGEPDQGVKVRPFGFFVLPRTDKTLVVEENIQGLLDQPPKWKERARF